MFKDCRRQVSIRDNSDFRNVLILRPCSIELQKVQECDATDDDSSNAAGPIQIMNYAIHNS